MDTGKEEREAMPQLLSRGTLSATTSQRVMHKCLLIKPM